jgi:helix-turn-helix protein
VPSDTADTLELITESEAARLRRQSERTLQSERQRGDGCPFVKLGHSVRYRRADVLAFIAANVKTCTSDTASKPANEQSGEPQ